MALGTGAVRVYQATNRGEVAGLEGGNRGTDLSHAADNLMARNNRGHSGDEFAPRIPRRVKIGVADPAEEDFNR